MTSTEFSFKKQSALALTAAAVELVARAATLSKKQMRWQNMILNLKHSLKRSPHDFLFSIFRADPEMPSVDKAISWTQLGISLRISSA